ncbi:hypothetical protein VNO78_22635 [Psophocarpus tetragonolobus]|uniref:Uncharacterized protein n=1 Tax=Psophocarpus tetragonolobus TaxID=3891 RepID=A0AAN9XCA5_PSOTE
MKQATSYDMLLKNSIRNNQGDLASCNFPSLSFEVGSRVEWKDKDLTVAVRKRRPSLVSQEHLSVAESEEAVLCRWRPNPTQPNPTSKAHTPPLSPSSDVIYQPTRCPKPRPPITLHRVAFSLSHTQTQTQTQTTSFLFRGY